MRIRWAPRALAQLREAHAYIAKDNQHAARVFAEFVIFITERLAEFPGMGLPTDESGIIVFPVVRYRYLIYYKVLSDREIRIVRIRHTSRAR